MMEETYTFSDTITLFADFDSANMQKYERIPVFKPTPTNGQNQFMTTSSSYNGNNYYNSNLDDRSVNDVFEQIRQADAPNIDAEFNIWTKPDCFCTPHANANRSWFYFGVKGGHGRLIRFNIMNLNRQAKLFELGMLPVFRTIPGHEKWSRIYMRPTWQNLEVDFQMSFCFLIPDKKGTVTYFAFCYPFSYEDCQNQLQKFDADFEYCHHLNAKNCTDDTIYYHREPICKSLDNRRVDLLTITNCNDISFQREPRFDPNLFPDKTTKRPFNFSHKRVFVLTSRVHPGETPASFVFNGFLEFILNKDDPRAKELRRNFVFKLIPLLNPDGVYRGHYRTDQLGMNLNRVYLDPNFKVHPSIYAAKSLIVYHHIYNRVGRLSDGFKFENIFAHMKYDDIEVLSKTPQPQQKPDSPLRKYSRDKTPTTPQLLIDNVIQNEYDDEDLVEQGFENERKMSDYSHEQASLLKNEHSASLPSESMTAATTKPNKILLSPLNKKRSMSVIYTTTTATTKPTAPAPKLKQSVSRNDAAAADNSDCDDGSAYVSNTNKNSPHLNDPRLMLIDPYLSGIAFYVDLHGHAAKRGCFIYGNAIDNEQQQIENVLFPKLISFNSQHFDFEGCNFSVKNMYYKDKREGLSKEGSGRVALFKTIGLIHSYTLECCYASGRVMNIISPAMNSSAFNGRISPSQPIDMPPKFLPEHYQNVGKALAIAALDMFELNPCTRIPNTTFGSLDSVRNWVKFYIRSKLNQKFTNKNPSGQQAPPHTRLQQWKSMRNEAASEILKRKVNSLQGQDNSNNSSNKKAFNTGISNSKPKNYQQPKKPAPPPPSTVVITEPAQQRTVIGLKQTNLTIDTQSLQKNRGSASTRHQDIKNAVLSSARRKTSTDAKSKKNPLEDDESSFDEYDDDDDDTDDGGRNKPSLSQAGRVSHMGISHKTLNETTWFLNDKQASSDASGVNLTDTEKTIKDLLYENLNKQLTEMGFADNDSYRTTSKTDDQSIGNYASPFREVFPPRQNSMRINLSAKTLKNESIGNNNNNNLQKVVDLISAVNADQAIIKPFKLKGLKTFNSNQFRKPNNLTTKQQDKMTTTANGKTNTNSANLIRNLARKQSTTTTAAANNLKSDLKMLVHQQPPQQQQQQQQQVPAAYNSMSKSLELKVHNNLSAASHLSKSLKTKQTSTKNSKYQQQHDLLLQQQQQQQQQLKAKTDRQHYTNNNNDGRHNFSETEFNRYLEIRANRRQAVKENISQYNVNLPNIDKIDSAIKLSNSAGEQTKAFWIDI